MYSVHPTVPFIDLNKHRNVFVQKADSDISSRIQSILLFRKADAFVFSLYMVSFLRTTSVSKKYIFSLSSSAVPTGAGTHASPHQSPTSCIQSCRTALLAPTKDCQKSSRLSFSISLPINLSSCHMSQILSPLLWSKNDEWYKNIS